MTRAATAWPPSTCSDRSKYQSIHHVTPAAVTAAIAQSDAATVLPVKAGTRRLPAPGSTTSMRWGWSTRVDIAPVLLTDLDNGDGAGVRGQVLLRELVE